MLHEGRTGELSRATRLLAEARAAAELKHPNVVEVLDADLDEGVPFVVMELLAGRSLREEWRLQGAVAPEQALAWMLPIFGAVATAHRSGILHRDIKLDNIFLAHEAPGELVPKLLDFGLARPADTDSFVTESGAIVGTPAFMAPEQAQGEQKLGPGVDVWALGVVMFALLSGRLPFEAESSTGLLVRVVTAPAPRLAQVAPEVPPNLAAAVDRALQRDLSMRYQSVLQLAHAVFVAAKRDGLTLPSQPDPIGLSQWSRWSSEDTALEGNTDSITSLGISAAALGAGRARGARRLWGLVAGAALALAAVVALASSRQRGQGSAEPPLPVTAPVTPVAAATPPSAVEHALPQPSVSAARSTPALGPSPRATSLARPSVVPSVARRKDPMVIDPNYE